MNTPPPAAEEYLSLRRRLGYKLGSLWADIAAVRVLPWSSGRRRPSPAIWSSSGPCCRPRPSPRIGPGRLSAVRLSAQLIRRATDSSYRGPCLGLSPGSVPAASGPYLYSEEEITRLMGCGGTALPHRRGFVRRPTARSSACSPWRALRISEAIALDREDVDLEGGILTIRRTSSKNPSGARSSIGRRWHCAGTHDSRSRSSQTTNEQLSSLTRQVHGW